MKLSAVESGQVVRNLNNGSFYRYERQEGGRCRIRPLEHFPNGLLIPKTAPTTVEATLEVELVGPWFDPMVVKGKPTKSRIKYEDELSDRLVALTVLEAGYQQLPIDGVGRQSRGSHANKLKACRDRIEALQRGLGEAPTCTEQLTHIVTATKLPDTEFKPMKGGLLQLPSGNPALALANATSRGTTKIRTRWAGSVLETAVPTETLRPWAHSAVGTI